MKLTDKFLKGVKPKESAYRIFEKGGDKGFGLKVTPAGSISFFIQYTFDGKKRFFNLGAYPSVSLSEARDLCRETRKKINEGVDPQQKIQTTDGTVSQLLDYYIEKMKADGKRSWEEVKRAIDNDCSGIMMKQAKDVAPEDIRQILHSVIKRGSEVQSNRLRSYLHRMFELGIKHDYDPKALKNEFTFGLDRNPVGLIPTNPGAEKTGERNLTFDELRLLWSTKDISESMLIATKLLVVYGCRTWELLGAKKEEFDFNAMIWTMPPERIKTDKGRKRAFLLPITNYAKTLLEEAVSMAYESDYVFPGRTGGEMGETSLSHALRRVKGIEKFTPRDLRRTTKTRMGEIGISKEVRDILQNHARGDVSAVHYDRYEYMKEKLAALELWCERLSALEP